MNRVSSRAMSLLLSLLMLLTVLSAGGCSRNKPRISGPSKTVTDCAGREVEIPEDPQRVIAMYASSAHMMAMLDVGDRIVGAADGVRRDQLMTTKYPDIENVPAPFHEGEINVETVMELNADLLLVKQGTYADEGTRDVLERTGVPYVVIDYTNLAELQKAIGIMGEVFGKQELASAYLQYMEDTFADVERRIADVPENERPRVYHAINQATRTDIRGSLGQEIFHAAGLFNMSADSGATDTGKNTVITLEQIYAWDPAALVCNEYLVTDYIKSQKKWAGLTAVQNGSVYTLPIGATRWGHHGSMEPHMAALYLAQLFYPDRFADLDLRETVRSYYKDYWSMELDDDTMDKILSGRGMRESSAELAME